MSKSSELDKTVKLYILACIDASGYQAAELKTTQEKIDFLRNTFKAECQWNIERIGETNALREWLMGLPSSIHIEFMNYNILQLAILWGSIPEKATEKQEEKIIDNYWNFMANKINQLFTGYAVPDETIESLVILKSVNLKFWLFLKKNIKPEFLPVTYDGFTVWLNENKDNQKIELSSLITKSGNSLSVSIFDI